MDVFDLVKLVLIPVALAVTAHQYMVMWKIKSDLANKVEDKNVRDIIADKVEALKQVDTALADRIQKVEEELIRINDKLDLILELLYKK